MVARVLPQEYLATDQRRVVLESIDTLQILQQNSGLTRGQQAALDVLERLYMRTVKHRGAVIPAESVSRSIAIARAAMKATQCAR